MALYYIDGIKKEKKVTHIPHQKENEAVIQNIPPTDLQKIRETLQDFLDKTALGSEVLTSSWIPGSDWTGTVYEPIYIAAKKNIDRAAMVFGTILFQEVVNHENSWSCGRYQLNGKNIKGMTYFRIRNLE